MKLWKKLAAAAVATVALTSAAAPGAKAITGGTIDTDNNYSNVGLIVFYDADGRFRCTATLVTPTVLLTAAHCTAGTLGKTIVTFVPDYAPVAPTGTPVAADVTKGYDTPPTWKDDLNRIWYSGTAYAHPQYSDFTDKANWNDVGVVKLDTPVVGIRPAAIADAGLLDTIAKPDLSKTLFRIVGYGTHVEPTVPTATSSNQGKKPAPATFPLVREYADAPGQKLTPQILQVNGNINDTRGTGGSCFGDSGGPTFYQGKVVTVTSYGYTQNCRYLDGLQRVDIKVVQDWLATYGVKP